MPSISELRKQITELKKQLKLQESTPSELAIRELSRAHTIYKNSSGEIVPSVTRVIDEFDSKSQLIDWSNALGLDGIESEQYAHNAANIGTLAHDMIRSHLLGDPCLTYPDITERIQLYARNAFNGFLLWEQACSPEILSTERKMVSNRYGGTCDLVCRIAGKTTLVDYKTGKRVYPKLALVQIEAYAALWDELQPDQPIERLMILHLDRDSVACGTPHYSERRPDVLAYFKTLLTAYEQKKAMAL